MRVDRLAPDLPAGHGVERIDVADEVAEIEQRPGLDVAGGPWADDDAGADFGGGIEGPARAAGLAIERIDRAVMAADKDRATRQRGLRARAQCVGKGERPFQLQRADIGAVEARNIRGNRVRARRIEPPAGEDRRFGAIEQRRLALAHQRAGGVCGAEPALADILRDGGFLVGGQSVAHLLHHAGDERAMDRFGRHLFEDEPLRRAVGADVVAGRADLAIDFQPGRADRGIDIVVAIAIGFGGGGRLRRFGRHRQRAGGEPQREQQKDTARAAKAVGVRHIRLLIDRLRPLSRRMFADLCGRNAERGAALQLRL